MNILIVGGAGFIGCNLADYYASKGGSVFIVDNLSRKGASINLRYLQEKHQSIQFICGDIRRYNDLQSVFARRNNNDALLSTGSSEWESALHEEWTTVLSRFQTTGAEIFLLLPPLRSTVSLETCLRYTRCVDIQFQDESIRNATLTWWETVRDSPNVYTVELDSYLCPLGNPCPEKINGVAVRVGGNDQTHFTEDGAEIVAVLLMEMISEKSSTFN